MGRHAHGTRHPQAHAAPGAGKRLKGALPKRVSAPARPRLWVRMVFLERPRLPVGCQRLSFGSGEPMRFSDFPGSAWRGGFGHTLAAVSIRLGQWTHAGAAASMGNGAHGLASLPLLHGGRASDTLRATTSSPVRVCPNQTVPRATRAAYCSR